MIEVCSDREEWEDLLRKTNATVFHTWDWLKLMERHSKKKIMKRSCKAKMIPLKILDGSDPIGICPVFIYKGFAKFVFSPPMGVESLYLGPLVLDYDSLKKSKRESRFLTVVGEIDEYLEDELNPNFVLFHTTPNQPDSRPFKWLGYDVEPRYTYVLKLNGIEDVWKGYHRSLRRGIDKARKKGIEVREGDLKDLKHLYNLLKERNRIHATEEFVVEVYRNLKDNVRVFVAEKDGERLSGIVNVCYRNRVSFWIGAPKFSIDGVNPNELVFHESMRWAIDEGYEFYEIMGADDRTLYDFKRKFNGDLEIYFTVRKFRPSFIKVIEALYRWIRPRYG